MTEDFKKRVLRQREKDIIYKKKNKMNRCTFKMMIHDSISCTKKKKMTYI